MYQSPSIIRPLRIALLISVLTLVTFFNASNRVVFAQEPSDEGAPSEGPNLAIELSSAFSIANLSPTPVFQVGDQFQISITALGIDAPGLFGSQFEINYDPQYLNVVEDSLSPGSVTEPVVNPIRVIDNEAGQVRFAASRQGDLENLTGNIVLATLTFEAVGATEPPSGQTTTIALDDVRLGAKGGVSITVAGIVDLALIIQEDDSLPGLGDIIGVATVEGRDADNQAGHTITLIDELDNEILISTNDEGDFWFDDISAGTYDISANRDGFLVARCEDLSHAEATLTELLAVNLLAGDIDSDEVIDISDAVAIGQSLGETDSVADLNADQSVDVIDLILMATNYGQTSGDNPWTCQLPVSVQG